MSVTSQRSGVADLVRAALVLVLAVVQVVASGLGGSGAVGDSVGAVAQQYATPLLAAGWAFGIWAVIYLAFVGYAVYQLLPTQRSRAIHRRTGWWLAASAVLNSTWILAFSAGLVLLAELIIIGLLVSLVVVFVRLATAPPADLAERVLLRGPVGLYLGWVSMATALGTAATGVAIGLPGDGPLAETLAVIVLLMLGGVVAWVVLSAPGVVPFAAAVLWALAGIALRPAPAAVAVTCAVMAVLIIAAVVRRVTRTWQPHRAAWG